LKNYTINLTAPGERNPSGVIKWEGRGVDAMAIVGGDNDNTVILDEWNSEIANLDGGDGLDKLSVTKDANMTLRHGELQISGTPASTIKFSNFEHVSLTGGAGNNTLDASAFSGSVSLDGQAGNDTLIGTEHDDELCEDSGRYL